MDDDPEFLRLVSEFLEREPERIEVISETDADDAIQRFTADRTAVDCIVSDYDMPGTNGLEFLDAIRE